jgi:hypothetical protein
MKLVIVGGVAGGASAAARSRRLSEAAQIVVFERGPDVSYANCGLPYYVGGEIVSRDKLLVVTPERLGGGSTSIFGRKARSKRSSVLQTSSRSTAGTGHEYFESYDKLILAAELPCPPSLESSRLASTLRNLQDVDRIRPSRCGKRDRRRPAASSPEMVENLFAATSDDGC